ncbi:RNA methyltransferase [Chlamydia sp. 17-3921]|uniref:TrmH family RNA methyltransferase n=1 Tax=Chlamydia sp. 17-3921 TaxID=2675798 RepID=UPI00191A5403|nr:RNA methyltransferase [Chlamydia sp. 17-3921]
MEFLGKHNPKIKEALALKRSYSKKGESFLVEGVREIQQALYSGFTLRHLFCSVNLSEEEEALRCEAIRHAISVFYCMDESLSQLSYKQHPSRVIAVVKKKFWSQEEFLNQKKNDIPFYFIIEGVEKPGNVGAILRIADGVGVDGVILCDPIINLYNPNLIRSSLGTVFTLPILCASFENILNVVKRKQLKVFATSPIAGTVYFSESYCFPTALVFGSEKDGLTESWFKYFKKITLPMRGKVDSLNLSTAVAAIAYEVVRQRIISKKIC